MGFRDKLKKAFIGGNNFKSQTNEDKSYNSEISKKPNSDSIKSFRYLNDLICGDENNIILECDVVFDPNIDYNYQDGIEIKDRIISIDGDGHMINASSLSRIFKLSDSRVTIKNTIFKNGFNGKGSAIYSKNSEINFNNVNFTNNSEYAVEGDGNLFIFENCHFENNLKGAISINLGEIRIDNSVFKYNGSRVIHVKGDNLKLKKLTYVKVQDDANLICNNSIFENNTDCAIWCRGNLKLTNVIFKNNENYNDSAIISQSSSFQIHEKMVIGCEFTQNGILADSINIFNSTFVNCQKAICLERSSKIKDSYFFDNNLAVENRGYLNIENTSFKSNENAIFNGELKQWSNDYNSNNQSIFNLNSHISILNSNFRDNISDILNEGTISVYGTTFNNCSNTKNLIYQNSYGSHIDIAGCQFRTNCDNVIKISSGSADIFDSTFALDSYEFAIFNEADLTVNNLKFKDSNSKEIFIFNDNILKSNDLQIEHFTLHGANGKFKHLNQSLPKGWKGFDYLNDLINKSAGYVVLDCDILMHDAEYEFYAGGIELSRDNLIINGQNHTIDANHMSKIFHVTGNNIVLKNIRFINGFDFNDPLFNKGGGALYNVFNASLKLVGCEFCDNESQSLAGAVKNNGNISIENTLFKDNAAISGGVFVSSNGLSKICDCRFESNVAEYNGGTIQVDLMAILFIKKSTFQSNTAKNSGGAILNLGQLDIVETDFIANKVSQWGGAIYTQDETKLKIFESKFIKNNALGGGAINTTRYANFSIYDTCFKGNTALHGGAIYDSAEDSSISSCSFLMDSDTIKSVYDD